MKIITLNINGLRGMININDFVSEIELNSNLKKLKTYVDSLCIGEEDIIVLQEVPHKVLIDKSRSPWLWEEQEIFQKFRILFEEYYTVFYPRFLIDSQQCTLALAHKNTKWNRSSRNIIQYNRWHHYGNKLIEAEMDDITLLGVHIKPCDEMWRLLLNSLRMKDVTFIVGDFNAYEKRGEMKGKPAELRKLCYNSVLPCNVITDYRDFSSLDNLYINNGFMLEEGIKVDIHKTDLFVTDHACCIFEM